jgi:uncharacterized protein YcbK (DUF882 family)
MTTRRQFLSAGLVLAAMGSTLGSLALPSGFITPALAETASREAGVSLFGGARTLDLYRPAAGERLTLEYMRDGVWREGAYERICWLLRDVQAHDWVQMDTRIIAIMDWTQKYLAQFGYTSPLHILSGFRSLHTNEHTEGAAKDSQHLVGKAIDARIPGLSTEYLGRLFRWLSSGGVGIYDSKEFVHVDVGTLRNWRRK